MSTTDRVQGGKNIYDAVFTDKKDNATMEQADFLKLLMTQMQNQDFTNPMDNTQMVEQMAAFSNMQMMQEMASYSKTNYAMSLVGKSITASRFDITGNLDSTTGAVEKVSLLDNEFVVYVNGKKYTLEQIMSVQGMGDVTETGSAVNPKNFELKATDKTSDSVTMKWQVPTEDDQIAAKLKYSVYYSKDKNFSTVEDIEKGTLVGAKGTAGITTTEIQNLEANTTYYVNVVVTDAKGIKSVYKPATATTRL